MNPPKDRCTPLGTHSLHIDGDTVILITDGLLTHADMKELLDHFVRIKQEKGLLFVLYDGRRCTGLDSAARKLGSISRKVEGDANLRVAFGVPFAIRIILAMLIRAQKVLLNRDVHVHLFDGEQEAYAFFETERTRIRHESKK